jgi:tripartite-type tricarboxylate transporter receptor subunit TctC
LEPLALCCLVQVTKRGARERTLAAEKMAKKKMPMTLRPASTPHGQRVPTEGISNDSMEDEKLVATVAKAPMTATVTPRKHRRTPQLHRPARDSSELSWRMCAT